MTDASDAGPPGTPSEAAMPGLILDNLPAAAAYLDREGRCLFVNAEWERSHGLARGKVVGKAVAEALAPDGYARLRPAVERALAGERARFEWREPDRYGPGRDGWTEGTCVPHQDGAGRVLGVFVHSADVTERKAAEAARAEGEERMRVLLDGVPQLLWRSCDKGMWTWSSVQWRDFTGQTLAESLDRGWLDAVHPDDRPATVEAWDAARAHGTLDVEFRVRRAADGAYFWHHTRSRPVRDEAGRIVEWLGSTTDVQELKELQERQAVMVSELQHRTRNLIAVVRSIADQTLELASPGPDFAERFGARMGALARVQGLLSRADDEPITLEALIRSELDALGAAGRASLDGPPVRIRAGIVQTLALALHELATNARKYGALSGAGGRLAVRWAVRDEADGRRLRLDWTERLDRPIEGTDAVRHGYGRRLIDEALPYSLGARTEYALTPSGAHCSIDLPLERPPRKERP